MFTSTNISLMMPLGNSNAGPRNHFAATDKTQYTAPSVWSTSETLDLAAWSAPIKTIRGHNARPTGQAGSPTAHIQHLDRHSSLLADLS